MSNKNSADPMALIKMMSNIKERVRKSQAEARRKLEKKKDEEELRRSIGKHVDIRPVLGGGGDRSKPFGGKGGKGGGGGGAGDGDGDGSSGGGGWGGLGRLLGIRGGGGGLGVKWEDHKEQLQQFYSDHDGKSKQATSGAGFGFGRSGSMVPEDDDDSDDDAVGGGAMFRDAHSPVPEEFRRHTTEAADVSQLPEEFFQTNNPSFDPVDYVLDHLPAHLDNNHLIPCVAWRDGAWRGVGRQQQQHQQE
jgi:hypothetical protein